jgi:2-dehydro-3-deoxyphosphogluconate aldolase / (4S)-4-hydroxy-2-oxoglutarate aldolase
MSNSILDKITENKIIAVTRGISSDKIIDTVRALMEGGIRLFEVPYNQKSSEEAKDTLNSLRLLKREFGDRICVGPGTVLTVQQVVDAVEVGADYIISPSLDIEVIKKTKNLGKISIPGALTPSEIVTAYNSGADIVKIFPGAIFDVEYIKAITAPLNHIPIIALGGISVDNVDQFIKAGVVGVGIGGNLVDKKKVYAGEFEKITMLAKEYVNKIKG